MKNKLFSLCMGLMVILLSPMVTSCDLNHDVFPASTSVQADQVVSQSDITAEVSDLLYVASDVAKVGYSGVQDVVTTVSETPSSILNWQNILNVALLLISTLLAVLWKRAKNTLKALSEGLEDNNLSKDDLSKIINAWKGK